MFQPCPPFTEYHTVYWQSLVGFNSSAMYERFGLVNSSSYIKVELNFPLGVF